MSVASHLGINLAEYDSRIRTFIPQYETMLDVASAAVPRAARTIVDLGTGTGALAARCLERAPRARVTGIDVDSGMLAVAARRLGPRAEFVIGSFLRMPLPRCDVAVASFSLHHVRTLPPKAALYERLFAAMSRNGKLIVIDCLPASDASVAREQHEQWKAHLRRSYSPREARRFLTSWSREDVYVPLDQELDLMKQAGFRPDVLWRQGAFAVVTATRGRRGVQ